LGGRHERTALVWCCFGVALCLFELAVYLLSAPPLREFEYPTLSTLLEPLVAQPLGRLPLLVGWLVLGLALLRWSQGGTGRVMIRPSKGVVVADSSVDDVPTVVDSSDPANGHTAARPDRAAPPDGAS